jgi:hypothetical protein
LANDQARAELANAERDLASLDADASRIAADIDRLQLQLAATRTKRDNLAGWLDDARSQVSLFEDPDIESIRSLISQAEEHNAAVRERKVYAAKADELKAEQANSNELTEQIAACERDKADLLKTAAFPIPGLGFSDDGVMFNELPFDQASQAEQIRASVAIGAALQPRLRVMLVKDGSLLDSRGLALLEELARQHDLQVWIERVEPGTKAAVLIEDGIHVVEPDAEPAEVVAGGAR